MNDQPLHMRASFQEIRRHWLLVTLTAALCALAGMVFFALRPADSTAVTLVLLPTSAGSNSGAQTLSTGTQAIVAKSTPVLVAAGSKVAPTIGPTQLKKILTISSLSQQVLAIQVRAPQGTYAEELANAVASSYITYAGQLSTSSSGVKALQQESSQLTQQVQSLQNQINTVTARIASEGAASGAGQLDSDLVTSLQNEQDQVALRLNDVNSQLVAAQASGPAANSIRVLQRAAVQPSSRASSVIEAGFIGLAIGLFISCAFVLLRRQSDLRLHFRDEIASAAGVPVIASLSAPSCTTVSTWRTLLESEPSTASAWALRRVLYTVQNSGAQPVSAVRVISFADDWPALATGPLLVLYAASSGTPTALLPGEERQLEPLRASLSESEPVGRTWPFAIGLDDIGDPPRLLVSIELVDNDITTFGSSRSLNVLSISAGFATADELTRIALQAAAAGSPLDMVVVVNPDPADETKGITVDDRLRLLPFAQIPIDETGDDASDYRPAERMIRQNF